MKPHYQSVKNQITHFFKSAQGENYPTFGEFRYSHRAVVRELERAPEIIKRQEQFPVERKWYSWHRNPARSQLKEIVANPSPGTAYLLLFVLKFIWNRIFSGVEVRGLEENRQEYQGKTLIYMPCHRSHLDSGLLSYIVHQHNFPLPHAIAGDNLNIPIVGNILKRCGAVFIRRVFKGEKLYSTVFLAYLYYLLDHQFSLEFFIEGGRARTGKNLPPKTGFLSMLVQYLEEHPEADLHLVPVSNVYDRIMEEASYVKELGGLPKRKENLGDFLRAHKLLSINYGKVYVSFAPPVSLRGMVNAYQSQGVERADMLYAIGTDVMDAINQYCVTSATPLISTALLSEKKQGFRKHELLAKVGLLIDLYHHMHPRSRETLVDNKQNLDKRIDFMLDRGSVGCLPDVKGDVYFFRYQNKILLNIYKNITVHHFVIPSVLAWHLQKSPQTMESSLENISRFEHLFRYEFMFPVSFDFKQATAEAITFFLATKLIQKNNEVFQPSPDHAAGLSRLSRILLPFRESFQVVVYALKQAGFLATSSSDLVKECQQTFLKLYFLGYIESAEANLTVTYQNIIRFLTEEEYLSIAPDHSGQKLLIQGKNFTKLSELVEQDQEGE
ncbi:1-acyl-sn-glycerol-3-phosphate acyltransferase [Deltaproteobacteria bacterium TL4]